MTDNAMPTYETLMNPALQALRELGGSATIEELYNKVVEIMGFSDEQLEIIHDPERGSHTEIEYRLAWTRSYLKKYGLLENSSRGVWALTQKGRQTEKVNPKTVSRYWRDLKRKCIHQRKCKHRVEFRYEFKAHTLSGYNATAAEVVI